MEIEYFWQYMHPGAKEGNRKKVWMKYQALVSIFVIVFLSYGAQAAAPVSESESRFVWEPGENLSFTWTNENFDGFYCDAKRTGKESLTIKLDNIEDRSIPGGGIVYSTTVETATARYSPFGEYAVIGLMGGKYLAGEGKSNISEKSGFNLNRLQYIMIYDNTSHTLIEGSNLSLGGGYVLEARDVDAAGSQVTILLRWEGIEVDTKTVDAGKNYVYKLSTGSVITVHIDSVFEEKETVSVNIKGIFQVSNYWSVNEGDMFGVMKVTRISNRSITMRNTDTVNLKQGSITEIIGNIKLKVADSNTLRLHLYSVCYENHEHRGQAGSHNLASWDGLNYAGFLYDVDSGNYSESLVITNISGRRIPENGLTYTSYIMRVPYAATKAIGEKISGTDGSYIFFRLGGKKYTARNNGFAELLMAQGELTTHGDSFLEKKTLVIGYNDGETWELGEGYTLTALSVNYSEDPGKARLVLKRNGTELDDIWLKEKEVYRYAPTHENGTPKLITYLDACFSGTPFDMIQLRYTWFVSDNVTQIKEGERLGIFKITALEPDRILFKNRVPIDLKPGSSINLVGNLSFFVENSDELRFYPTNMAGVQVIPERIPVNEVMDTPEVSIPIGTSPIADRTEKTSGFESVLSITVILAAYIAGRKMK